MRPLVVVLAICLLVSLALPRATAVPVTIYPENCYKNFDLLEWDLKRFGPYVVCKEGTVRFRWKGMHGVFQIPSIACPSNFTSGETETYKFLAPVSNGGGFDWKVPEEPGHYWITSQHADDCRNGMIAEVFVVNGDEDPFPASHAVPVLWSMVATVLGLVWMYSWQLLGF
ncbi:hypothetical protein M9434_005811 [Picochlorum sp. BPE23]|nr:hypothetical protein M9434_005811 [Picochlorum sp. BPE23]KAI8103563.1 hypothetical protein M9435_004898 [Picochlorum sp. BPE23]